MQLIWRSRQGRQRRSNNDALALGRTGNLLVCLLVDAAEKGTNSQRFAQYWGQTIVAQLLALPNINDSLAIFSLLEKEQQLLRHHFLREIASYCLLCLDTETGSAQTFHIGDCRAGVIADGDTSWWHTPHTLEYELQPRDSNARHTLTRSLNAKRFIAPEMTNKQLSPGNTLVIATDGYWAECLQEGQPYENTLDDASFLTLEPGMWRLEKISDTDNSFIMTNPDALGTIETYQEKEIP